MHSGGRRTCRRGDNDSLGRSPIPSGIQQNTQSRQDLEPVRSHRVVICLNPAGTHGNTPRQRTRHLDTAPAYFFERNLAGRGLDFDEFLEHKADFLRYAIQLNCINHVRDITKFRLPLLVEIARGASIQLQDVVVKGTQSRKDLDNALKATRASNEWFIDNSSDCEQSVELNIHLGAEGAMSPGWV